MLFDLRGRGRRRTVQVIYISLALLMGGGLILFGVGGSGFGLLNADQNSGGGGAVDVGKQVERAHTRAAAHPQNAKLWLALAQARFQLAGSDADYYNENTQAFTAAGKRELASAGKAWQRYLALDPKKPSAGVAAQMAQAYASVNDAAHAAGAMEIVAARNPSVGTLSQLAAFAYQAGQTRKGDLAAARALKLAPKSQRSSLKTQLDTLKKQGASAAGGGAAGGAVQQGG